MARLHVAEWRHVLGTRCWSQRCSAYQPLANCSGCSSQARRARAFDRFWDVMSFCINGLIFFFVGASSVNYLIRWDKDRAPAGKGQGRSLEHGTVPYVCRRATTR